MEALVNARNLSKKIEGKTILENISFKIEPGQIVGLIGANGAGKTTLLKGILGLSPIEGELSVLGMNPVKDREQLIEHVSFIADTAILPGWMKVSQLVEFIEGVHPKFNREKALGFLAKTNITLDSVVKKLSKGMVTQLHLALIMAIDSKLLVLDEPTLGLDIVFRKQFYESLLNDYYDQEKTIIITTHQVEEVEGILTHLMFMKAGDIVLDAPIEKLEEEFCEVQVTDAQLDAAMMLKPIYQKRVLGAHSLIYRNANRTELQQLGKLIQPNLADIFVACMSTAKGVNQ